MPNDKPITRWTETARQGQTLAALVDAAAVDLVRNGPVPPDELRRRLEALEAEWAEASSRAWRGRPAVRLSGAT